MPKIAFTDARGVRREVLAPVGITLMEAARQHDIAGVIARCGGACACGTCHVYVDTRWLKKLGAPEEMEEGMLETVWEPRANSRLSCQVHVTADLDGMEVTVPSRQSE